MQKYTRLEFKQTFQTPTFVSCSEHVCCSTKKPGSKRCSYKNVANTTGSKQLSYKNVATTTGSKQLSYKKNVTKTGSEQL
jgi:hypothetical protein